MKNTLFAAGFGLLTLLASCSKNNSDSPAPAAQGRYLVLSNDAISQTGAGYLSTTAELPSGTVSTVGAGSLQSQGTGSALQVFNNWVFKKSNSANEAGIQKLTVGTDGRLQDQGFIKASSSGFSTFAVVSATQGFYSDDNLGKLKLQLFNPTTMQRTGELDLAANLAQTGTPYATVGRHVLAATGGKLFADVYYSDNPQSIGLLDYKGTTAYLAVIDLATGKYEKTISLPNVVGNIGLGFENPAWTTAADGTLYICTLGSLGVGGSKVVRVKPGTNDFDTTWSLDMNTYRPGSAFVSIYVKDNTLYTQISTEAIKSDFSNLYNEIWELHSIDLTSKQATKVPGINTPVLFSGHAHATREVNGKLYFRVIKSTQNLNGYYVLDGGTAKPAFGLSAGGNAQDFLFIPQ